MDTEQLQNQGMTAYVLYLYCPRHHRVLVIGCCTTNDCYINKYQQCHLSWESKFGTKMRFCSCVLRITTLSFISWELFTMIFVVSSVSPTFYLASVLVWKWNNSWNTEGGTQLTAQQWWQRWSCKLHSTDEFRLSASLEHIKNYDAPLSVLFFTLCKVTWLSLSALSPYTLLTSF